MTDNEKLNRKMAEATGWPIAEHGKMLTRTYPHFYAGIGQDLWLVMSETEGYHPKWNPTERIEQAMMVADRIAVGWTLHKCLYETKYRCTIRMSWMRFCHEYCTEVYDQPAKAICLAVEAAREGEQDA